MAGKKPWTINSKINEHVNMEEVKFYGGPLLDKKFSAANENQHLPEVRPIIVCAKKDGHP